MTRDMPIDAQLFWSEVRRETSRAQEIVSSRGQFDEDGGRDIHGVDGEKDVLDEQLSSILKRLRLYVLLAADVLQAHAFRDTFDAGWKEHEESLIEIRYSFWSNVVYCPALQYLNEVLLVLSVCIPAAGSHQYRLDQDFLLLGRILEGAQKIIYDKGVYPKSEADVRREVFSVLLHVFPDTVRDVPIPQVTKTYKPDLGIRSLKTAIEFKFLASEEEAKKYIGGLYEDVHGYGGSSDWERFYAVVYMTDPYLTRHQLEAEWRLVGMPDNWRLIPVIGSGGRKKG